MAGVARQRVEVLPDGRDLGAVPDLVAHAEEDVLDLAPDLRQQVQPAAADRVARDRHVDAGVGGGLVREPQQILLACGDGVLEPRADAVQEHPALAVAHPAERLRELRLAAEVLDAGVVELALRRAPRRSLPALPASYAVQSTAARLSKVPPSFRENGVRPRCG